LHSSKIGKKNPYSVQLSTGMEFEGYTQLVFVFTADKFMILRKNDIIVIR
jgi:hypothetical protein